MNLNKIKATFIILFYISLIIIGYKFTWLLALLLFITLISYGVYLYVAILDSKKDIK